METKVLITDGELAGQEGWLTSIDIQLEPRRWEIFLPQAGRLVQVPPSFLRPVQLAAIWPERITPLLYFSMIINYKKSLTKIIAEHADLTDF